VVDVDCLIEIVQKSSRFTTSRPRSPLTLETGLLTNKPPPTSTHVPKGNNSTTKPCFSFLYNSLDLRDLQMASQITKAGIFKSNHLVIVTESRVLSWDAQGPRTIFTSGSKGILAAKESNDGNGTLAIADRHLVLLHEVTKGMERSYKLKGAEVGYFGTQLSQELTTTIGRNSALVLFSNGKTLFPRYFILLNHITRCCAAVQPQRISSARLRSNPPFTPNCARRVA
jgi:hypothetical protein